MLLPQQPLRLFCTSKYFSLKDRPGFVEESDVLRFFFGRLEPVSDWQEKLAAKFRRDFGDKPVISSKYIRERICAPFFIATGFAFCYSFYGKRGFYDRKAKASNIMGYR